MHRFAIWAGFAVVLILAPLCLTSSLSQSLLSQIGIAIIVCLSYNLLLGQGGLLSFGHAVYSGMGAFWAMHALNHVSGGWALPVSLIPLVGGLGSMALALLLGWVSTAKAGTPFAMITLGLGELVWAGALMFPDFFGGEGGVTGNRVAGAQPFGLSYGTPIQLYYLIAFYTLVCTALMFAFTRTPLGRLLNAVRDNPERVAFTGHDPHRVRYLALVIAAFFAGVSGGLAALHFENVSVEVLSASRSGAYLLFTFLGGTGFFIGPIIGAVLMVLAFVLLSEFTKAWLLYLGLLFVLTVLYAPGGAAAWLASLSRQHWRRQLVRTLAAWAPLPGMAALVEMLYHQQLNAVLGTQLPFLGLTLDCADPRSWGAALLLMLAGLALWRISRRGVEA